MSVGLSCGHLERGVCLRCENMSLRATIGKLDKEADEYGRALERLTTERDVRQQYGDRMRDERDEARAEVERLQGELGTQDAEIIVLKAALRSVAERQREACAKACELVAFSESYYSPNLGDDCAAAVRATPLVTEKEEP